MSSYQEIRNQIAELEKLALSAAKIEFAEKAKVLFDKYPEVENFSYTQYTPHFNDGDECVFRCNTEASINGMHYYSYYDESFEKAYIEISNFIEGFNRDDLKEMFGDHAEIIVHRDGTCEVNEYEHN